MKSKKERERIKMKDYVGFEKILGGFLQILPIELD
jgi:hypothetical protein